MTNKTPQPKEKTEEEKREEVAKLNLDTKNRLWDYASPKLITHEEYGGLANEAEAFYFKAISETPSDLAYKSLFLPQLLNEGGAITSPYIQKTSQLILQESLSSLKAENALSYCGYKGALGPSYSGKYITQLDPKIAGAIVGSAMQYQKDEIVKKILSSRQENIPKGLEQILAEPKKPEPKK